MNAFSYCYKDVKQIDDESLTMLEDKALNLLSGVEVCGCARDTLVSKRSGLQRLLQIMTTQPFDILLIDDIQQIGSDDTATEFLHLLSKKNVRVVTAKDDVEPDKITLKGKTMLDENT